MGANSAPTIGNSDFALTCTNAPAGGLGLCLVADVASPSGNPFGLGFELLLDLVFSTQLYALDAPADGAGFATASAPLPFVPSAVGATLHAQDLFFWSSCSPSPLGLSSSDRISFTLLP